ncbi:vomeronasal type-2 receptor 26-like [Pyxicephalus adspersus]|uniref:vomeronasal type-2 receptor 26-like n=1 Tax=Pyxicephalus adspersus TaxID=30357 RepID=UPI003B5A63AC
MSGKQSTVSLSSTEAEFVAAAQASKEILWLREMLADLDQKQTDPTQIFEDNQGCIAVAQTEQVNSRTKHIDVSVDKKGYTHLLTFIFAINEINHNPDILPNVTLGYHLYDSCGHMNKATKDVLQILSGHTKEAPNYSCMERDNVAGFIGDLQSDTTLQMAQLLNLYGYTQVARFIKTTYYKDSNNIEIHFKERGDLPSQLVIVHWMTKVEEMNNTYKKPVGDFNASLPENQQLTLSSDLITWKRDQVPKGRCSECLPGFRKVVRESYHICCYDCIQCSEGEISNQSDSENCQTCPENEWPNDEKNICVSRNIEFLSYDDVVVFVFSVSSVLFAATCVFILGIFFWFRSTPMVKANNRNLSFILLCSLTLSFLSMFLFLGRPVDITCMLQQISFGIVFTISVSSILAKTIMVSIAFKATRPGSSCRKWVGVKLPNTVMLFCSSIQVINGILWLSISPPFQEYDMHSYPRKIIVQCNEGSTLAFYITLGYMGVLAAVSFVLAFMVRTLPDSFNEAKYITFSMLVFCSVWIAMIPAYLSTKGKYMVAVEVFAILASSAGVLFCIFFPKLYILLLKPELNTRKNMLERRIL